MKQIEREMKGEEADATDDEVSFVLVLDIISPDFRRKMCSHLLTQMSHTMNSKIESAQSMPRVAEHMLRPTTNLRMMQGADVLTKPGLHSSQRMMMRMIPLKMPRAASLDLQALIVTRQLLTTI
jgi:hypothetical protein